MWTGTILSASISSEGGETAEPHVPGIGIDLPGTQLVGTRYHLPARHQAAPTWSPLLAQETKGAAGIAKPREFPFPLHRNMTALHIK